MSLRSQVKHVVDKAQDFAHIDTANVFSEGQFHALLVILTVVDKEFSNMGTKAGG